MAVFMNRIKELRTARGWTQDELAERLGVSRSRVGMYETGRREPDFETLEAIADLFNVDMNYLLCKAETSNTGMRETKAVRINVYGKVAAGIPINMIEDVTDWEEIPAKMANTGNFFALRISGHSMEPKISDGDIVIVKSQDTAETGDIVIAAVNGDDATCKRYRRYKDGIELIPLNPAYEPMFFSDAEVRTKPVTVIGKVVELRAKF